MVASRIKGWVTAVFEEESEVNATDDDDGDEEEEIVKRSRQRRRKRMRMRQKKRITYVVDGVEGGVLRCTELSEYLAATEVSPAGAESGGHQSTVRTSLIEREAEARVVAREARVSKLSGGDTLSQSPLSTVRLVLVSNQTMPIKGRDYKSEDMLLALELRQRGIKVQIVLPETLLPMLPLSPNDDILNQADVLLFRNNYGGVHENKYRAALNRFVTNDSNQNNEKVFNEFVGCKGDYLGKKHLLDLYHAGYPVIPSTTALKDMERLKEFQQAERFIIKSMMGADSNDIWTNLTADQVREIFPTIGKEKGKESFLIQPMIDFSYEVSFYYFENEFMYAMYNGAEEDEGEGAKLRDVCLSEGERGGGKRSRATSL